jgi:pimeloyl-ACP methyl ester carboxylesterase
MANFIFLHGGGQGGWVWDETIAALDLQSGGTARCLALDGPGCGAKRGRDTQAMSFDAINADLIADVEAAGMAGAVLVGHSQAGINLPRLAEMRPGLFARLVYISTVAPEPGLTVVEMAAEHIHAGAHKHPFADDGLPIAERSRRIFCNDMDPAAADAFVAKLGADQWPGACYTERDWRYDRLADTPATYVLCLADAIMPLAWQERFATRFHAGRTVRIDAGHQVMNTRPHALAEVLLAEAAPSGEGA